MLPKKLYAHILYLNIAPLLRPVSLLYSNLKFKNKKPATESKIENAATIGSTFSLTHIKCYRPKTATPECLRCHRSSYGQKTRITIQELKRQSEEEKPFHSKAPQPEAGCFRASCSCFATFSFLATLSQKERTDCTELNRCIVLKRSRSRERKSICSMTIVSPLLVLALSSKR